MKKLLAILMIGLLMLSLTGCFAAPAEPTEAPTEPLGQEAYEQNFKGLQQYLMDRSLIPSASLSDPATPDSTAETTASTTSDSRTEVYYGILGADDGVRYTLQSTAFIELYDFTNADNDTAKAVLADIKDDGKFYVIEGYDEMTGVISKSGKYVAVYNAKNGYDYAKITDELENW